MRNVSSQMTNAWKSEDKTGPNRPVVRATIQTNVRHYFQYDAEDAPGGDYDHQRAGRFRHGYMRSILLGTNSPALEVPNIKSFTWSRSVNQDVAEATMVLHNVQPVPMGTSADTEDYDRTGYMSPSRGDNTNPWGFTANEWHHILVPDRLVKTYEGYGFDPAADPALDSHLLQSGCWRIEDVTYTDTGEITLKMFDIGVHLQRAIVFPPNVPYGEYPLTWEKLHTATDVPARDAHGGAWHPLTNGNCSATSSNSKYVGKGLSNAPYANYVSAGGAANGHTATDVLDSRDNTYWLSTGQDSNEDMVWWEANLNDSTTALAGVRIQPYSGPYRMYISIHNGTKWLGQKHIPYTVGTGGVDINADIPFVLTAQVDKGAVEDHILPRKYGAAAKVRITLTRLRDSQVGEHPFTGGLRKVSLYTAANVGALSFSKGTVTRLVGNYSDFTDIVKYACGWQGFFWPPHASGMDFILPTLSNDPANRQYLTYASPDPKLPIGRIWGDFMNTGTAGVAPLTMDLFDKKPLMDMISYIRDLTGFVFFIDETGGVVWRLPNVGYNITGPKLGNYLSPTQLGVRGHTRTSNIVTIDGEETLLGLTVTLSSKNSRERIFVADVTGKMGVVIKGYVPDDQGYARVAGWTDQNFGSREECVVMADMIAAQQLFDYHRANWRIPGYPAIQIDDQVRLFERTTNETFYHYVESISSTIDMDAGTWFYDCESHWLGENPSDVWAIKVDELYPATKNYLAIQQAAGAS